MQQQVTVLGATGSIGVSTLDVLSRHPDRYRVFALSGHSRLTLLAEQAVQFLPHYLVVGDEQSAESLAKLLANSPFEGEILYGVQGLCRVAADNRVDTVMAAIVGAAGLAPTLAAVEAGKRVLLANKEALVMAGPLFMRAVATSGALLLPIDSEHNAIFQALPSHYTEAAYSGQPLGAVAAKQGVDKLLLTASGGPFREWSPEQMAAVTPAQAVAHPNWSMGAKISVDSATLMNKGLELIEAAHLFAVSSSQIEVVVHPQSIIHSLVQYRDGSLLAQLGNPDMRTPIAHALAWPERIASGVEPLDLVAISRLDFTAPDLQRFPALRLAYQAAATGGAAPAVLNAANEVAVAAFLAGQIGFLQIAELVATVLESCQPREPSSLEAVQLCDRDARRQADEWLSQLSNKG